MFGGDFCGIASPKRSADRLDCPPPGYYLADTGAIEAAAHGAYVDAINSNNLKTLVADLTDDIVYQSPGEPEIFGKAAVRQWPGPITPPT
jgi:hypothetical protein